MEKEKNIGYKAMENNMTCRGYQFELGKTYEIKKGTELKLCENGFHFCFDAVDCLEYYINIYENKRFFKIQYDKVITDDIYQDKGCTNKITILEEIDIFDYIRENKDKVNWDYISRYQKLSEDFIKENKNYVDWEYICRRQKLSEGFIKEFKDRAYWCGISKNQILSEGFIREFKDWVDWFYISSYQKLSESFIREFKDSVDWYKICINQTLSESFIREFEDYVDWNEIYACQKLSKEFFSEFYKKICN